MKRPILITLITACTTAAAAQGGNTGSATLGGAPCADTIAGYSVDEMIAAEGSIERLHMLSSQQIEEYDRWLVEMENVLNQGVREADIQDLYNQGIAARADEVALKQALECRMGR